MEILAGKLDWLATDEQNLAAFLDTPTGQRLIPKLLEEAPPLFEGGAVNEILIRSGKVLGYAEIARTILALAHPVPKLDAQSASHNTHPSLEDDSQWEGPKLSDPPEKFFDSNPQPPSL